MQADRALFRPDEAHDIHDLGRKLSGLLRSQIQFFLQIGRNPRLGDFAEFSGSASRRQKLFRDSGISGVLQNADHAGVNLRSVNAFRSGMEKLSLEGKFDDMQCPPRSSGRNSGKKTAFFNPIHSPLENRTNRRIQKLTVFVHFNQS